MEREREGDEKRVGSYSNDDSTFSIPTFWFRFLAYPSEEGEKNEVES